MTITPHNAETADLGLASEFEIRNQVLSNLLKVSTYLVSVLNPEELLTDLVRRVVEVVPAVQAGQLWLFDRQLNQLRVESSCSADGDLSQASLHGLRLRPGEGLPGMVLQRGEPILLDNRAYREIVARVSPRSVADIRAYLDLLPRDLQGVALPLRIGNEVIGVLELLNLGSRILLHRPDLQVLQTFANLAAGAIHNAQLHAQMQAYQRRLEAFSAIGTVVSTAADLSELVGNGLDVILSVVGTSIGALLLLDPARSVLTLGAHRSLPPAYIVHQQEIGIASADCEEAVRYGQPIRRLLIAEGGEEILIDTGLSSCAYIPLLAGGTVVGIISLFGDNSLPERVDVQALMMIGSLIGFAIANVRLYQESQNERRKLTALVNSIAEGVALCDRDGQLVLANQTALELLSIEHFPYQIADRDMSSIFAIRDLEDTPLSPDQLPLTRALAGEVYHDYRVMLRGASGNNTVMSFTGAPVHGDGEQVEGAVVVFRDVTLNQKVERAKDDFLAVAAHELRSPLAAVRGYTDLLLLREQRRGSEESSPEMRGLNVLAHQVGHMLRLVDSLLDVSRLAAGQFSLQFQRSNLIHLAGQAIEQLRPNTGERILVLDAPASELTILCDPLRIRQVLTNLISNAIRYSPNGTTIMVRVWFGAADRIAALHPVFAHARAIAGYPPLPNDQEPYAVLSVTDQGSGMSSEQIARLFKRYARGNQRAGEGLGLGLYLSREFITRHQGEIWVESQEGRGSVFYVALPSGGPSGIDADGLLTL
ncbi:MAG: GAF domain-containing protein [Roseiflexaceae bacterium]|nr:GAF domain-containing protein [Roseiflexaceae bacterium]